jgi:hypothetical protein
LVVPSTPEESNRLMVRADPVQSTSASAKPAAPRRADRIGGDTDRVAVAPVLEVLKLVTSRHGARVLEVN